MDKDKFEDILLVEDEPDLGLVLAQYLRFKGIRVHWSPSAEMALEAYAAGSFRLVIIDVQLPEKNGFELAKEIQQLNKQQAFFFLTAHQQKESRMQGLELGAIDYIGKPFEMEELMLKIKNFLSIQTETIDPELVAEPIKLGNSTFVKNRMLLLTENGKQTKLTVRETDILDYLILHKNQLVLKKDILQRFWGDTDYFNGKSLEVFISRIRKLLLTEPHIHIDTVYGAGYILVDEG
ncbi:response regulator transcription factor [Sphingobacterium hungaricum]